MIFVTTSIVVFAYSAWPKVQTLPSC